MEENMGKEQFEITGTIDKKTAVDQVRKASRQFAMLYFHFSKVLVEEVGQAKAKELIQQAVFELAIDRSEQVVGRTGYARRTGLSRTDGDGR